MTNEEAKAFLDNLKICIDEHPIVADWLVEIADRKTEPQSCEWCKFYDGEKCFSQEPCKVMLYLKDEPTISKMEQVEDEPQIYGNEHNCIMTLFGDCSYAETGCGSCEVVEKVRKALDKYEPKDEPQIFICPIQNDYEALIEDEPQIIDWGKRKPCTLELFDDDGNYIEPKDKPQTENPCDGCVCDDGKHLMYCMNCKGIAWKTEPPKIEDEPQTDCSWR